MLFNLSVRDVVIVLNCKAMIINNKPETSSQSTSEMQTYSVWHNSPKVIIKRLNLHSASDDVL